MGVNETDPGGMVPEHKHDVEEEVMFFISGKGKFITKDREIDVGPGICVYNPPRCTCTRLSTPETRS